MKQKLDYSSKIDKTFRELEGKFEVPDNNIVEESIQRSMFGIFTKNFKQLKETQPNQIDIIVKKYFKDSAILDDSNRTVLYFNLPFSIIKERI